MTRKQLRLKQARRFRRRGKIRRQIRGTADCPRLSVYKSNRHMYLQAIDDGEGRTLAAVSSTHGETKGLKTSVADGKKLGQAMGAKLKELKIETAVFDRNGYLYHGVVKSIADGTREAGIKF